MKRAALYLLSPSEIRALSAGYVLKLSHINGNLMRLGAEEPDFAEKVPALAPSPPKPPTPPPAPPSSNGPMTPARWAAVRKAHTPEANAKRTAAIRRTVLRKKRRKATAAASR